MRNSPTIFAVIPSLTYAWMNETVQLDDQHQFPSPGDLHGTFRTPSSCRRTLVSSHSTLISSFPLVLRRLSTPLQLHISHLTSTAQPLNLPNLNPILAPLADQYPPRLHLSLHHLQFYASAHLQAAPLSFQSSLTRCDQRQNNDLSDSTFFNSLSLPHPSPLLLCLASVVTWGLLPTAFPNSMFPVSR